MDEILSFFLENKDEAYAEFSAKLIPTVEPDSIIGIRTPILRNYAKEIVKKIPVNTKGETILSEDAQEFLSELPHRYYEENQLHGFIVAGIKNFELCLCETEKFLPYIDNWSTCDTFRPNVFKKNPDSLLPYIDIWLASEHTYTVRYAIGMLMGIYLDDNFKTEYHERVATVKSDEYYINMMAAWYWATALAKQYDATISYIEERKLTPDIHKKAIQKAVESFRVSDENKNYLRTLRY